MEKTYTIDIHRDNLIQLPAVVEYWRQRFNKRLHRCMPYRWTNHGVLSADGELVRLPSVKVGGLKYTSIEAIAWWSATLQNALPATPDEWEVPQPLIKAELKRYGIIPCSRCAFFRPEDVHPGGNRYGRGTCRRQSPKRASWPEVNDDPDQGHGCGEGLLREEAAPLPPETNKETK